MSYHKQFATLLILLGAFSAHANNRRIFVAPNGCDRYPGTMKRPVASFARAQELARCADTEDDIVVTFADGTYYLGDSIVFTPEDNRRHVTYRAQHEGKAILSGGRKLRLQWKPYKDGIFVADVNGECSIDQLYVDGKRQRMARFPNAEDGCCVYDAWNLSDATYHADKDALSESRTALWAHPEGGYIHAMHNYLWGDMHWLITGRKSDGELEYKGGWQNNRPSTMHGTFRFVENIFEELDVPGEWFFDTNTCKLYYMPDSSTNLETATIEVVRLQNLITFQGSRETPVTGIALSGFVFRHTARTFMQNKEPLLRSDWTICRTGGITLLGTENCEIRDCEFDQLGGNTIVASCYNRNLSIRGCHIHDSGASGVVFVGNPECVRNALFSYGAQDYTSMSWEKGPAFQDYPDSCKVEDCLISRTGRDEKQTAGIQISMSHAIHVDHCSIYEMPRAGINIGDGTFGGHIIENSDIFDTVLETGDHGSFNSWGRDRYWSPDPGQVLPYTEADPELPLLDMLDPIEIRHNRWRCDHGWDIDLDDGSSWYNIHDNLCLNGGIKLREGYYRRVFNNIILHNSLNPHVWFSNGEDRFYSNIVTTAYRPAAMTSTIPTDGKWGCVVDYNLFAANDEERLKFAANGCDAHSISAYPEFVDSIGGDFRVRDISPARNIGFQNFRMDDFGVQKPSLCAITKKPRIPDFHVDIATPTHKDTRTFYFYGVLLSEPHAQELSAYGVGMDEGGVAMSAVEDGTEAAKAGFRSRDLIQAIEGTPIGSISDLRDFIDSHPISEGTFKISLVRNQSHVDIVLQAPLDSLKSE